MKQRLPWIAAGCLVFFDALLKSYVVGRIENSSVALFCLAMAGTGLLISGLYLFFYFRRNENIQSTIFTGSANFEILVVCFILFLGTFARFWNLDGLFNGLWFDEAYKGLDAIAIREMGERSLFLTWNGPREPMASYLITASSYLSGYSIFSIRAVEAFAGSATLLFFYLFVRKILGRDVALLSLFLLAVSKQHLIYSRLGYRINLSLLFEIACLYCLSIALLSEKRNYFKFILAGAVAGLGAYTYTSYRIFPFVLLAFVFDSGIRTYSRRHAKQLILSGAIALILVAPLAWFHLKNPDSFTYRMQSVALWNNEERAIAPELFRSARNTFAMFTFKGDSRARQNVPHEPSLSPFLTGFFLLGIVITLSHIRKPFAIFLLLYFLFALIPGILSRDAPHFGRTLGALPPAILFCSTGILAAFRFLSATSGQLARAFLYIVIGGSLITGPNDALFRYSKILDGLYLQEQMNGMETNVANYLNDLGPRYQVFLSPQLFFHATTEFLTYSKSTHALLIPDALMTSDKIKLVVLVPGIRDLWWLRDDDGKNYFWWWNRFYNLDVGSVRTLLGNTYQLPPRIMDQSDAHLIESLKLRYPKGREVYFDQFAVYLFR